MSENQIKLAYGTAKIGDYVLIVINNYMNRSTTITSGRIHNDGYVYDARNSRHRIQNSSMMICKLNPSDVPNIDKEIINKSIKNADDKRANSDTITKHYVYTITLTVPESITCAGKLHDIKIEVKYKDTVKIKNGAIIPETIDKLAFNNAMKHKAYMVATKYIHTDICRDYATKYIDRLYMPYYDIHIDKEKIKKAIDSFDWMGNISIKEVDEFEYANATGKAKQIFVYSNISYVL